MNDFLTDDTKAILLLCSELGKTRAVKPLTQTEYNRLGNWLIKEKMRPADLLQSERVDSIATSSGIESNRLQSLLGRGVQLGLTVEQWQQNSIWILSRSDEDYPGRYKEHLKIERPPLLFGVGDKSLLQGGGVAIVGSRDVDSDGEHFAREVGKSCAKNRISVVSGGARGVDQIVMSAALEADGVVIGVLADDLLKKSLELETRRAIADDRLLLISSYHPTAHFTIGRAMERNKLIYALADCALVVSSDYKKGGTWTGVAEELERDGHRRIFVRSGANVPVGNKKLLNLVVHEYDFDAIKEIVRNEKQDSPEPVTGSAATIPKTSIYESVLPIIMSHLPFRFAELKELAETLETETALMKQYLKRAVSEGKIKKLTTPTVSYQAIETGPKTIYEAVLPEIIRHLETPTTKDELAKTLDVRPVTLEQWLRKAVKEGKIQKLPESPVRYQAMDGSEKVDKQEELLPIEPNPIAESKT